MTKQVICEENTKWSIQVIDRLCKFVGIQLTIFPLRPFLRNRVTT